MERRSFFRRFEAATLALEPFEVRKQSRFGASFWLDHKTGSSQVCLRQMTLVFRAIRSSNPRHFFKQIRPPQTRCFNRTRPADFNRTMSPVSDSEREVHDSDPVFTGDGGFTSKDLCL